MSQEIKWKTCTHTHIKGIITKKGPSGKDKSLFSFNVFKFLCKSFLMPDPINVARETMSKTPVVG